MQVEFHSRLPFLQKETVIPAIKHSIVGVFCAIFDFILHYLLTVFAAINYVTPSIISFIFFSTILNYVLYTYWIFKIRAVEKRPHEFIYYAIISAVSLGINTGIFWLLEEFAGAFLMLSKLMATFATYWWIFFARKYFLHSLKD